MFRSTRPLLMAGVAAAAAMVAACSTPVANGSAPETSGSSRVGVETTASPVTDAPTTTIPVTTVETTTDTAPPTVPPTTAPPPPPTTVAVEDQVRADFQAARAAREQCSFDPTTCAYEAIAVPGSPVDVQMHEFVWMRVQMNARTRPDFDWVESTVESVTVSGETAQLTVCTFDAAPVFEIHDPANPNDDVVFDDSQYSTRSLVDMALSNGRWLMVANTDLERAAGGALCGL